MTRIAQRPALVIALATFAVFFALAAAGSSPPLWMWVVLIAVNAAAVAVEVRRTRPAR